MNKKIMILLLLGSGITALSFRAKHNALNENPDQTHLAAEDFARRQADGVRREMSSPNPVQKAKSEGDSFHSKELLSKSSELRIESKTKPKVKKKLPKPLPRPPDKGLSTEVSVQAPPPAPAEDSKKESFEFGQMSLHFRLSSGAVFWIRLSRHQQNAISSIKLRLADACLSEGDSDPDCVSIIQVDSELYGQLNPVTTVGAPLDPQSNSRTPASTEIEYNLMCKNPKSECWLDQNAHFVLSARHDPGAEPIGQLKGILLPQRYGKVHAATSETAQVKVPHFKVKKILQTEVRNSNEDE